MSNISLNFYISSTTTTTATISALPIDVLIYILSLLDGPSLASISCTSTLFRSLSSQHSLWLRLCLSSFPSTADPRLSSLISSFRSFYSDASSSVSLQLTNLPRADKLSRRYTSNDDHHHRGNLLSAVDLSCGCTKLLSRVFGTDTRSTWFLTSPFQLDALDRKDPPVALPGDCTAAEFSLNWIIFDPVRRRAVNLSSGRQVSVQRHWFSGETQVRFATVVRPGEEVFACAVVVTCGGCDGGREVREVSLQVEDLEGMNLSGRESLELFGTLLVGERRREDGEEMRQSYMEFLKMKLERKERKMRREGRLDMACLGFGLSIFALFLGFVSFL